MAKTSDSTADLTKYERARVIGARALQISMGAPSLVKGKVKDPILAARQEFEKGVIPIIVLHRA